MDSVDLEVLRSSVRRQQEGHRVLLVTVVRTWGSSPRPEGAMLAVRDDGLDVGAVSGGWPKIISNVKSLLETGKLVLQQKL